MTYLRLTASMACATLVAWTSLIHVTAALGAPSSQNALHAVAPQVAPSDDGGPTGIYGPTPTDDGFVYAFDVETDRWIPVPVAAVGPTDPKIEYRYALSPACFETDPFEGVNCAGAAEFCAESGQSGMHEDVWRMEVWPTTGAYVIVGAICTGGQPRAIPTQEIVDAAQEYERTHLPQAVPRVQPGGVVVVNLPVLASVSPLPVQTMVVQLPVPGVLVATPSYAWTFDDGTNITGAGLPYDGTDPRVDPGHYVAHTYVKAQTNASVSLTVSWTARFTAAGQTIDIPAVVMPAITTTFSVHEARSVLVSN
jgi:hypothetical protein